jgi:hypothetical protein
LNFAPLPRWLEEQCDLADTSPPCTTPACELDTEGNVYRATLAARQAEPGEPGRMSTLAYAAAGHVKDQGVSEEVCVDILLEHWPHEPALDRDDIAVRVHNAYRHGKHAPGCLSPEACFKVIPMPLPETTLGIWRPKPPDEPIPRREFILGTRILRHHVSALLGAPGTGKSYLALTEGLAVATGRPLTGDEVRLQGRVLVHNAEDDEPETRRRLAGAMRYHGIEWAEIAESMLFTSGSLRLIRKVNGVAQVVPEQVDALVELVRQAEIVLVVLDPLVSLAGGAAENSNEDMEVLLTALRTVARRGRCGIRLVHHIPKDAVSGGEARAGDMNIARGGGAIVAACRAADTLIPMRESAEAMGVPEAAAGRYVRLDSAKGNYSERSAETRWFEKLSVGVGNGVSREAAPFAPDAEAEDTVAALAVFDARKAMAEAALREDHLRREGMADRLRLIARAVGEGSDTLAAVRDAIMAAEGCEERTAFTRALEAVPTTGVEINVDGINFRLTRRKFGRGKTAPWIIEKSEVSDNYANSANA